jgi:Ca2+-binding RTX toxin-like protein
MSRIDSGGGPSDPNSFSDSSGSSPASTPPSSPEQSAPAQQRESDSLALLRDWASGDDAPADSNASAPHSPGDLIRGVSGGDVTYGPAGDVIIYAGAGKDIINRGVGTDRVLGREGSDRILGGVGDDQLHGKAGNDDLFSGLGDDKLFGGLGQNLLRQDFPFLDDLLLRPSDFSGFGIADQQFIQSLPAESASERVDRVLQQVVDLMERLGASAGGTTLGANGGGSGQSDLNAITDLLPHLVMLLEERSGRTGVEGTDGPGSERIDRA